MKAMLFKNCIAAINDPNTAKTTTEVDIKLVKTGSNWIIQSSDDIFNAITGTMNKALNNKK